MWFRRKRISNVTINIKLLIKLVKKKISVRYTPGFKKIFIKLIYKTSNNYCLKILFLKIIFFRIPAYTWA